MGKYETKAIQIELGIIKYMQELFRQIQTYSEPWHI